ncbi:lipase/esterase family protein [Aspergillus terreus]|uniref:Lipase/esterase family protein n=1 Tax=Aspergillus terreus TaxID=33178 RepID=A0A5M3Z6W0_ASPTE|nr:hypothetical protein ATETN484_0010045200 [Aspergillus terreus]GFF18499.1 lipase/esterase family protein [Aspergillus terreus]
MPLNTVALGVALTPTVVSTLFSHYLHPKLHHHKPSTHITYDEGIKVFREFLAYASKHTLEDLQAFTCQKVPSPHWVRTEMVTVPSQYLTSAAEAILAQLGPKGIEKVGGKEWWQWRGPAEDLKGEWIEMRKDYNERKQTVGVHPSQNRVMLYIHGGAYYFGSLETHRYQMQRHARKLKGRVFAPQYRLAPQFPFPCGLQDCLAAYLFLLTQHKPNEILFAGDSAGGGMALSLLVILRDQGLPLPAGAILISPWVDLTHSFPSIVADNPGDYIPPCGFRHKPSAAWPPPNSDELKSMKKNLGKTRARRSEAEELVPDRHSQDQDAARKGYSIHPMDDADTQDKPAEEGEQNDIRVPIDGTTVEVKDQIHMYTTNQLLSHPLVSPALQPSLGGLPPLQVLVGGGEMLRDEQFYVAHKAADPTAYPPSDELLDEYDPTRETLNKYPGTHVQLQVWEGLCHVAPTLSFTPPAKYMYRSIAQFGAWALACAQESEIDIIDDDEISPISSDDSDSPDTPVNGTKRKENSAHEHSHVGIAGDPLPAFKNRMIRQRVGKGGHIYPIDPPSACPVLQIPPSQVGTFNPVLVKKWLAAKDEWDTKFAHKKLRVQTQLIKELAYSFQQDFPGELPPACSLAARKSAPGVLPSRTTRKSHPMTWWSNWASKHDERTIEREKQKEKEGHSRRTSVEAGQAGASIKGPDLEHKSSFPVQESGQTSELQKQALGDAIQRPAAIDVEKANRNGDVAHQEISRVKGLSDDKTLSPLIVLPPYEAKKFTEDNASTQSLFHASGIIPATSEPSMTRLKRPSSHAGSATIRSGVTSEMADDTSTIGDKSLAVTNTGVDAASTRAVLNAKGVVDPLNDADSARRSADALSASRKSADLETLSTGLGADAASTKTGPEAVIH